ncbi:MAG: FtsK/SpoIIIE domain-containing protein, partial [Nitrosarchaeum sp.]|nr:FtsK/SpoIIIE domain-containing protein [Nitrosarchaeum sp.]
DREVSNPDPEGRKPKIKIKSLKTYPRGSTQHRVYKQLYTSWKGSGAQAITQHEQTSKLKAQLQERMKEIKSLKEQQKKVPEKSKIQNLKDKVKAKEVEQKKVKPKIETKVEAKPIETVKDKKTDVAISNKLNEQYKETLNNIKSNASKLQGSINILPDPPKPQQFDEDIKKTADTVNEALSRIKINATVDDVTAGPAFSTYHAKFNIEDLHRIQRSEEELSILMKKPVTVNINKSKGTADIEVQNEKRLPVYFKELVTSDDFLNKAKNPESMPVILGKDKQGKALSINLSDERSPHVLIVGQTGAGKSVLMQQIISSVLYGKKPEEAQIALLDPKGGAEFGRYDKSKNLFSSVAKSPKESLALVNKLHKEMDKRYTLFDKAGVSDVNDFNKFVTKKQEDMTDDEKKIYNNLSSEDKKPIPKVVLVADELSNLMSNPDIRKSMIRHTTALGQKARASGIHMVFATQRPSKMVIPTELQTQLPTKIIMKVDTSSAAKYVETPGAENLLGRGDMIVKGIGEDQRVQSGFLQNIDDIAKEFGGVGKVRETIEEKTTPTETSTTKSEEKSEEIAKPEEDDTRKKLEEYRQSIKKRLDDLLSESKARTEELAKKKKDVEGKETAEDVKQQELSNLDTERKRKTETEEALVGPEPETTVAVDEPKKTIETQLPEDVNKEIEEMTKTKPVTQEEIKTTPVEQPKNVEEKKKSLLDRIKSLLKGK